MKKILIIEDDPIITNIYSHSYKIAGYEIATAQDGEEGLRLLETFKPDLVQTDLMIPKLNGVEVLRKIRSRPETASVPVIVLSNCYLADSAREAWKTGANKVISKINCSPKVMLATIQALLNPPASPQPPQVPSCPAADTPIEISGLQQTPKKSTATLVEVKSLSPGINAELEIADPDTRQAFIRRLPRIESELRNRLRDLIKAKDHAAQLIVLHDLFQEVHGLAGQAGVCGLIWISHVASVLEVLLSDLQKKPKQITPSSLRTVTQAIDSLGLLFLRVAQPQEEFPRSPLILAVDDEPISRHTLSAGLSKAHLRSLSLDDPVLALKVLAQNQFDLIFLDVSMPEMDGFELCKQLRALPTNQSTPVVFVTSLSDFESRTRSILSGGTDLIAKPFLLTELAVKALILIVKASTAGTSKTAGN